MTTSVDRDQRMRDLAFAAIPSAWAGLPRDRQEDVIDLLQTYDHVLALKVLAQSQTTAPDLAASITDELDIAASS